MKEVRVCEPYRIQVNRAILRQALGEVDGCDTDVAVPGVSGLGVVGSVFRFRVPGSRLNNKLRVLKSSGCCMRHHATGHTPKAMTTTRNITKSTYVVAKSQLRATDSDSIPIPSSLFECSCSPPQNRARGQQRGASRHDQHFHQHILLQLSGLRKV